MAASLYFFTALQHGFRTAALALLDLGGSSLYGPLPQRPIGRESVSPEAVGAFPGAEGQTQPGRRFHAMDDGGPEPVVRKKAMRAKQPPVPAANRDAVRQALASI
jgi:hypothetical protein